MEHPLGLPNLGNTCYLNSAMQALWSSEVFLSALYGSKLDGFKTVDPKIILEKFPKYKIGEPADAHEFLLDLIDALEKEPKLKEIFYEVSDYEFVTPKGTETKKIPFSTIVIHPNGKTLDELFENLSNYQYIKKHEDYKVVCYRALYPRLPKLAIFLFSGGGEVTLPLEFKGRSLKAAVFHVGNCHYLAQVKRGDRWFIIDDERIIQVDGVSEIKGVVSFAIYDFQTQ